MSSVSLVSLEETIVAEAIVEASHPTSSGYSYQMPTRGDMQGLGVLTTDQLVDAALKDLETGIRRGELYPRRSRFTGAWMLDRCAPQGFYRGTLASWCGQWMELYLRRPKDTSDS